ncbi:hypothetical protein HY227_01800 [Candidatus Wolfebacteria bacterium]|nr:hypothetical protein [Candidatus Wolfebacteria bacterium]
MKENGERLNIFVVGGEDVRGLIEEALGVDEGKSVQDVMFAPYRVLNFLNSRELIKHLGVTGGIVPEILIMKVYPSNPNIPFLKEQMSIHTPTKRVPLIFLVLSVGSFDDRVIARESGVNGIIDLPTFFRVDEVVKTKIRNFIQHFEDACKQGRGKEVWIEV